MVGTVVYTLSARSASTEDVLCQSSVRFIISGLTIFETTRNTLRARTTPLSARNQVPSDLDSSVFYNILSGAENKYESNYRDNLSTRLKSFSVIIQFPDGRDASAISSDDISQSFDSLKTVSRADATSPIQRDDANCKSVVDTVNQASNCGAAFATTAHPDGAPMSFALNFMPYKDGLTTLSFDWQTFTDSQPNLSSESYENVLFVSVTGNPPPTVESLEPDQGFFRAGGQEITVIFDNIDGSVKREFRIGDTVFPEISGSLRRLPNGLYTAKFLTQPGKGTNLPIKIDVDFSDGKQQESILIGQAKDDTLSYTTQPLTVEKVSPLYAVAGQRITITGYFDGFDPSNPQHEILIGSKPLSLLGVEPTVAADGSITFVLPERGFVGGAYDYSLSVSINKEAAAQESTLSYVPEIPVKITIQVLGATYDEASGNYALDSCSFSNYLARLPPGVSDPNIFQWQVYQDSDASRRNLLDSYPDIPASGRELVIAPKVFGVRTGSFIVSVSSIVNGERLEDRVTAVKISAPIIGIFLSQPMPRTIAVPNVPVRITTLISPPAEECYDSSKDIEYEWTYEGIAMKFSFLSTTTTSFTDTASPSRLGREFIIPQGKLRYGNSSVSVRAYMKADPVVSGSAVTTVSIYQAGMVAVIGYGATRIVHSVARDLEMTAANSFNPDNVISGGSSVSLYKWTCGISEKVEDISNACGRRFLPSAGTRSFTLSRQALLRYRDSLKLKGQSGIFFLKYTLQVGSSDSDMSSLQVQVIEVRPDDVDVAKLDGIRLFDNQGNSLDWWRLRFYENIFIQPEGKGVTWSVQLSIPTKEASSEPFLTSNNTVSYPGYYDPSTTAFQSLPVGIAPDSLLPVQQYDVIIRLSSVDRTVGQGETRISIRTLDKPKLVLPELPVISGNRNTVFSASAFTNLDSTYVFVFYFFLVTARGDEFCLDGCSGNPTIQFFVKEPGTFRIKAVVRDIVGASVLDEALFVQSLTVTGSLFDPNGSPSRSRLADLGTQLGVARRYGDHGSVELLASIMASRFNRIEATPYSDADTDIMQLALDLMHQIVSNSLPSTMSSKSYVSTSSRFASMNAAFFSTEETMYTVLSMVHNAISQVARTDPYDLEDELKSFYNFSARHVLRAFTGTTRNRLAEFGAGSGLDARSLLVDFYLLQREHFTLVLSRFAACGSVKRVNTIVPNGVSFRSLDEVVSQAHEIRAANRTPRESYDFLGSYERPSRPLYSSFTVGVFCSPEQGNSIQGEATLFSWCKDVYQSSRITPIQGVYQLYPGRKRVFALVETLDYVSLSGFAGDDIESDTTFLLDANVTSIGSDGLQAISLPTEANCFRLNTSMNRLGVTATRGCLSADGFAITELGRPFEPKSTSNNMARSYSSVSLKIARDRSSTVLLEASQFAVFGAVGRECPINARKPNIEPPKFDVEFAYLVFGGAVVAIIGVTVTWVATSASYVGVAGAAAAA